MTWPQRAPTAFMMPICLICCDMSAETVVMTRKPESASDSTPEREQQERDRLEDVAQEVASGLGHAGLERLHARAPELLLADVDGDPTRRRLRQRSVQAERQVVELVGLLERRQRAHRGVADHHVREHRRHRVDVVREADHAQFGPGARLGLDGDGLADAEPLDLLNALLEHDLAGTRRPGGHLFARDLGHLDAGEVGQRPDLHGATSPAVEVVGGDSVE